MALVALDEEDAAPTGGGGFANKAAAFFARIFARADIGGGTLPDAIAAALKAALLLL